MMDAVMVHDDPDSAVLKGLLVNKSKTDDEKKRLYHALSVVYREKKVLSGLNSQARTYLKKTVPRYYGFEWDEASRTLTARVPPKVVDPCLVDLIRSDLMQEENMQWLAWEQAQGEELSYTLYAQLNCARLQLSSHACMHACCHTSMVEPNLSLALEQDNNSSLVQTNMT